MAPCVETISLNESTNQSIYERTNERTNRSIDRSTAKPTTDHRQTNAHDVQDLFASWSIPTIAGSHRSITKRSVLATPGYRRP